MKKGNYVVVRSGQAGVFAGEFIEKNGAEVTLKNARKIYKWDGAYTVEDIAVKGLANVNSCQITIVVPEIVKSRPLIRGRIEQIINEYPFNELSGTEISCTIAESIMDKICEVKK